MTTEVDTTHSVTAVEASLAVAASAAFATTTVAVSSVYMTQSILPELGRALGVDAAAARAAFSVASGVYALSFFLFGPLVDRFNRLVLARNALLTLGFAILLSTWCQALPAFLACMAVIGLSAAAVPAAMFPQMAKLAPRGKTGTYLGLILSASIVGVVLGRSLVGIIAHHFNYQVAFIVLSLACWVAAAATSLIPSLPQDPPEGRLVDAYAVALKMIGSPDMARALLVGCTLFVGYLGAITFLTLRLAAPPFRYSSAAIGWLSLAGISAVFGAPIAGAMTSRYGLRAMFAAGMSLTLLGLGCLAVGSGVVVVAGMTTLYLGVFATQPAMLVLVTSSAPAGTTGRASSLYLLACLAGGSLGTLFLGVVWRHAGWFGIVLACYAALLVSFALGLYQTSRASRGAQALPLLQRDR